MNPDDLATLRIEQLAREFHAVYQAEAKRQGDMRHHDDYDALPENIKEFDRVLARHVVAALLKREAEVARLRERNDALVEAAAISDKLELGWHKPYMQEMERRQTAERELARLREGLRTLYQVHYPNLDEHEREMARALLAEDGAAPPPPRPRIDKPPATEKRGI